MIHTETSSTELGVARGTLWSYITGFVVSIVVTLTAFGLVELHVLHGHESISHEMLISLLTIFAVVQLVVQLVFFLHLGRGSSARWNLVVLAFALLIVGIVVGGSLLIMHNLQHTTAPTSEMFMGTPSPQNQVD